MAALNTLEEQAKQTQENPHTNNHPHPTPQNYENAFNSSPWTQWLDTKYAKLSSPSFGHQTHL